MRISIFTILISAWSAVQAMAQVNGQVQATAQPLEVLYSRALERNEPYLTALLQAQSSFSTLKMTSATAWPSVGLTFGLEAVALPGITGTDDGETRTSPERFPALTRQAEFQLNIQQQLFQFGRLDAELERDDWQNRANWLSVTRAQAAVHHDIALAYLDTRTALVLSQIRDAQLQILQRRQGIVARQVQQGFLDSNDMLAIEAEVSNGLVASIEAKRAATLAQAELDRRTFRPNTQVSADQLARVLNRMPGELDDMIQYVRNNNIAILIAQTRVRAARAGEWAIARSSLPSLSWRASHDRSLTNRLEDNRTTQTATTTNRQDTRLGVSLQIPLFAGGHENERRSQAQDEVQLALRQLNAIHDDILAETIRQWSVMQAERQALEQWHNLVKIEQERVHNAERMLTEGFINLDDMIASQARLQALQVQVVTTSAAVARAKIEILHLLGLL